ncbi:uncharacterized protein LOC142570593 [Dermacentor variabilis]|uniref:uncharacterized protein LOC142570593 n=1 Tax=Dermacentor variabilis TaxID=34621 RepID=UPI003F5BAD28
MNGSRENSSTEIAATAASLLPDLLCKDFFRSSKMMTQEGKSPDIEEAATVEEDKWKWKSMLMTAFMCLMLLVMVVFMLLSEISVDVEENTDGETTTIDRPMNPGYVRKDLSGLVCHTDIYGFLASAIPDSCDFVMVDVPMSLPQPHPIHSNMATINIDPVSYETDIVQHMGSASGKALLLAVERRVLRSSRLQPNAVARGLVQKVVDVNAHGIALSDGLISEADTREIAQDAQPA